MIPLLGRVDAKDPGAAVFYGVDASAYLNSGATVSTATWSAPGLTVANPATTDTTAVAKFSGGQSGEDYSVSCTLTTSDGETLVFGGVLSVRSAIVPRQA